MKKQKWIKEARQYFRKRVPSLTRKEARIHAIACYENSVEFGDAETDTIQDVYSHVDDEISYWDE